MVARRVRFRTMYRLGFTPWDGHPLAKGLRNLVEGGVTTPLTPGTALDLGCGTGDNSIYLAQHGWQVTAVDFAPKALELARDKAAASKVPVTFVRADITRLSTSGVGEHFALAVDSGCFHGMSDHDREDYVREISEVTAPDAHLLIVAFAPGALFGVRGVDQAEIERLFAPGWVLVSAGDEPNYQPTNGNHPVRHYLLERRS